MSKKIDLTGHKYGRLLVIGEAEPFYGSGRKRRMWLTQCDCGNTLVVRGENLRQGNTTSCGCVKKIRIKESNSTHRMSKTRIWNIWNTMKERCNNPNSINYKNYGGRGIKICESWYEFTIFYNWAISNGYKDNLTIDRINNDGDYCPENCRWVTPLTQSRNKRNNIFLTLDNQTHCLGEWAEIIGLPYGTLMTRYLKGWPVADILSRKKFKTGVKHK